MKQKHLILLGLSILLTGCGNTNSTNIETASTDNLIETTNQLSSEPVTSNEPTMEGSQENALVESSLFYNKKAMEQYKTNFTIYGDVTIEIGSEDEKELCIWIMNEDRCVEQLSIPCLSSEQKFIKPVGISFEDINEDHYNDILIIGEFEDSDGTLFSFGGVYYQLPEANYFMNDFLFHDYLVDEYQKNQQLVSSIDELKTFYTESASECKSIKQTIQVTPEKQYEAIARIMGLTDNDSDYSPSYFSYALDIYNENQQLIQTIDGFSWGIDYLKEYDLNCDGFMDIEVIEDSTTSNMMGEFYAYDEQSDQFLRIALPNFRSIGSNKETNSFYIYEHGSAITGAQTHYIWKDLTTYTPYTYLDVDHVHEKNCMDFSFYFCSEESDIENPKLELICHDQFPEDDLENNPLHDAYWDMSFATFLWYDTVNGYTCYYGYDGENEFLFVVSAKNELIDEVKQTCNSSSQFKDATITKNKNGTLELSVTYTDESKKTFVSDLKF